MNLSRTGKTRNIDSVFASATIGQTLLPHCWVSLPTVTVVVPAVMPRYSTLNVDCSPGPKTDFTFSSANATEEASTQTAVTAPTQIRLLIDLILAVSSRGAPVSAM